MTPRFRFDEGLEESIADTLGPQAPHAVTCACCLQFFRDPVQASCGHVYCRQCILKVETKRCPICRQPVTADLLGPPTNPIVLSLLGSLSGRCGCGWTGSYDAFLAQHRRSGCRVVVPRPRSPPSRRMIEKAQREAAEVDAAVKSHVLAQVRDSEAAAARSSAEAVDTVEPERPNRGERRRRRRPSRHGSGRMGSWLLSAWERTGSYFSCRNLLIAAVAVPLISVAVVASVVASVVLPQVRSVAVDPSIAAAIADYRGVLAANHSNAAAHNILGVMLHVHAKDFAGAREHYSAAVDIDPYSPKPRNNMAVLLMDHYQAFDEARGWLLSALEVDPTHANTHNNLACLEMVHAKNQTAAYDHLVEALKTNPKHSYAHNNMAQLMLSFYGDKGRAGLHHEVSQRTDAVAVNTHDDIAVVVGSFALWLPHQAQYLSQFVKSLRAFQVPDDSTSSAVV